jgi:hypothetical protein
MNELWNWFAALIDWQILLLWFILMKDRISLVVLNFARYFCGEFFSIKSMWILEIYYFLLHFCVVDPVNFQSKNSHSPAWLPHKNQLSQLEKNTFFMENFPLNLWINHPLILAVTRYNNYLERWGCVCFKFHALQVKIMHIYTTK